MPIPEKMRAAVYYGPHDLRVEEYPVPRIGSDEALLRVLSSGICGTDLRIYHGAHHKYPQGTIRIPGHEVIGEIVAIGDDVEEVEIGQRIFVAPNMGCGHCRQCMSGNNNLCVDSQDFGITIDGAFAEFMRIPTAAILQGNLIPISEEVDPAVGTMIEPLACVVRGQRALNIQPGESVLVIGAGPIGVMHTLFASLSGASRVIVSEMIPERAAQAREFGADMIVIPSEEDLAAIIARETDGEGADAIIVAAPAKQAQETALELAAYKGRINYFGGLPKDQPIINFNSNLVHYKELLITGTTGCSTDDCRQAAAIVSSGRINLSKVVGGCYPLSETKEAFATVESGKALKVVLQP